MKTQCLHIVINELWLGGREKKLYVLKAHQTYIVAAIKLTIQIIRLISIRFKFGLLLQSLSFSLALWMCVWLVDCAYIDKISCHRVLCKHFIHSFECNTFTVHKCSSLCWTMQRDFDFAVSVQPSFHLGRWVMNYAYNLVGCVFFSLSLSSSNY